MIFLLTTAFAHTFATKKDMDGRIVAALCGAASAAIVEMTNDRRVCAPKITQKRMIYTPFLLNITNRKWRVLIF